MRALPFLAVPLLAASLSACQQQSQAATTADAAEASVAASGPSDAELLAQGEYLVRITGCNDCHTPGYMDKGGDVPTSEWLTGNMLGFSGPWGTTYPANLRLRVADMDDATWLKYTAELHTRPIMPDFNVRAMKEQDRLAIFRFIKSLGAAGKPAPAYLPPGQQPPPPYMELKLPPGPPPGAAAAAPAAG
jgi:mono/diheme cytochrome c family protein